MDLLLLGILIVSMKRASQQRSQIYYVPYPGPRNGSPYFGKPPYGFGGLGFRAWGDQGLEGLVSTGWGLSGFQDFRSLGVRGLESVFTRF